MRSPDGNHISQCVLPILVCMPSSKQNVSIGVTADTIQKVPMLA